MSSLGPSLGARSATFGRGGGTRRRRSRRAWRGVGINYPQALPLANLCSPSTLSPLCTCLTFFSAALPFSLPIHRPELRAGLVDSPTRTPKRLREVRRPSSRLQDCWATVDPFGKSARPSALETQIRKRRPSVPASRGSPCRRRMDPVNPIGNGEGRWVMDPVEALRCNEASRGAGRCNAGRLGSQLRVSGRQETGQAEPLASAVPVVWVRARRYGGAQSRGERRRASASA